MRLLVTGASSFVGAWTCRVAADRGHEVLALHHGTPLALPGVSPLRVDLCRPRDVATLAALDVDAVLHLAARIRGPAGKGETRGEAAARINRTMMDAVLSWERPVVYASSTVVHWTRSTPYGEARRADEARLRDSGRPFAILRPSAPYGPRLLGHRPRHRESFHTLAELVRRSPVVPVPGDGRYRRQPVHVVDFARALVAVAEQGAWGGTWEAGGAEALCMDEIVDALAGAMGRRVAKLHLPMGLLLPLAQRSPDLDPELFAAITEDELAPPGPLEAALGLSMRGFSTGLRDLL